jgi:hypothetical protein
MKGKDFLWGSMITLIIVIGSSGNPWAARTTGQEVVAAEKVADFIYSVIEADRTLYTTHVVQRMQKNEIVKADENWKREVALPLPAQMMALAGLRVKSKGTGLEHRLISLWPIYEKNRPASEFEIIGLEAVAVDPTKPYTSIIRKDGLHYFQAIYADKAVSLSCLNCHNNHPLSPKQDYKMNDVMGGIVISFPLSQNQNDSETASLNAKPPNREEQ